MNTLQTAISKRAASLFQLIFSFPDDNNNWTVFLNKADTTNINVEFVDEADPLNRYQMAVAFNDSQSL